MIFFFFGYPGIGKDFCAERLSKLTNIPHIDADNFLTKSDKQKLLNGTFTKVNRLKKLARIVKYIKKLDSPNITIGDSLPDQDSRKFLMEQFGKDITLIHVQSSKSTHLKRIKERRNHFFTKELLGTYINHWEEISITHIPLENSGNLDEKLLQIFKKVLT
ncbi:MAG: hypothetical protein Q7R49_05120 [Candidatus Daviesbacteria bacterium]|nr:hypothetical protein [Candidatus Daviesbacteria bacterium]